MNQNQNSTTSKQTQALEKPKTDTAHGAPAPMPVPGLVGGPATSAVPQPDPDVIDEVVNETKKDEKQREHEIKRLTENA